MGGINAMLDKLSKWMKQEKSTYIHNELDKTNIPYHVAIIMDGNGRWAKKRGLPRVAGHHEGMQAVKRAVRSANKLGIKILTVYAFSTENWNRPKSEVEYIMKLPAQFISTFLPELIEENVKVRIMGEKNQIPEYTLKAVEQAVEKTYENTGLILNFALNYGGRHEITKAVSDIARAVENGEVKSSDINEKLISSYLMSSELKDPDLLIRTSGEIRLSNFMLWQLSYTELWFTDIYWPDFKADHLIEAVTVFQNRKRRYGGIEG
jgi:undecaprenyl diphosphate synthase